MRATPMSMHSQGLVAHYELDGNFSDISGHYRHGHVVAGDPDSIAAWSARRCTSTATPRSASATAPRFDRDHPVHACRLVEGRLREPADHGVPEARCRWSRHGVAFDDLPLVDIQSGLQLQIRLAGPRWPGAIEIRSRAFGRRGLAPDRPHVRRFRPRGRAEALSRGEPLDCDVVHDDLTGDFATSAANSARHGGATAVPRGDRRSPHLSTACSRGRRSKVALHSPAQVDRPHDAAHADAS